MNKIAELIMLSFGWRRSLLMIFAGVLAAFSAPPFFILPLLFIALPLWIWALDGAEKGKGLSAIFGAAFFIGWFFGLGYFVVSLHWIGAAFFVDGGWIIILMPLAIFALSAILALFWGFASALAHLFWSDNFWRVLSFSLFLSLFELLRGFLFTGFPFNLLGYSLTLSDELAQITSLIGIYGTSFIAIFLASLPALIWPRENSLFPQGATILALIIISLGGLFFFGQYRINNINLSERLDIKLRLVQPAIDQSQKWQANNQTLIMEKLFALSQKKLSENSAGISGVTYVIWPEAAIPFFLSDYPSYLAQIGSILPIGKSLITGAPRKQFGENSENQSYNSILVINSAGEIISSYDKNHLVPFAEYLPFENFFSRFGIKQFVPGNEGWSAGRIRKLIKSPGAPSFLPLICYEAIFSGQLGDEVKNADFILNLTNDAWFDGSIGLRQHFYHARIRAIEEGRTLIRVANSGITAMIDPLGRISASLKEREAAILDVTPFAPLKSTIFSQYGYRPFYLFLAILLVIIILRKIFFQNKIL